MASVYALAHHETWEIGGGEQGNPFESGTIDKVRVDGKVYSSKPPILPLMMTAEYIVARQFVGLDLDEPDDRIAVLALATITFVTLPFVLSGIALWSLLCHLGMGARAQALGLLVFLWGTEYGGYAGTINNHVPATACLMMGLWGYFGAGVRKDVERKILLAVVGIVLGLAVTIDLPSAVFVIILISAYRLKFGIKGSLWLLSGFSLPIVVHCGIMLMLTGSPMPFQLNHDYYMYEESYWRNPVGIDALNHPWGLYLFNMTFGSVGIFSLYPILLIGAMGILIRLRDDDDRTRMWSAAVLSAMVVLGSYYVLRTNNYGGGSFGFRWLIISTPFLVVAGTVYIDQIRSRIFWGATVLLLVVSMYSSMLCRLYPWSVGREWTTRVFGSLT
jgi:hypothetical protein